MILVVEDNAVVAQSLRVQITKKIPGVEVSLVADAENAYKAITGKDYEEFNPSTGMGEKRGRASFSAVIWDNAFPERSGGTPVLDAGLRTIEALRNGGEVEKELLSRFISHSADEADRFVQSGYFAKVYNKPISLEQIKEIGLLLSKWEKPNL